MLAKPLAVGAAAIVALLLAALAWQTIRLHAAQTALTDARLDWERITVAALRRAADDTARWQKAVKTAEGTLYEARIRIADLDRNIAALRTANSGLRNQLTEYAAGQPDDTVAACQSRAGALAALLAEGEGLVRAHAELARTCARAHDERAVEVGALLDAWPGSE